MADYTIGDDGFVNFEHGGKAMHFRREMFGHTFTDDEIAELFDGKFVEFSAISKAGSPYTAVVSLQDYSFEGSNGTVETFGPRLDFDEMNRRYPRIPNTWCSHLFTDSEKKALLDGKTVHLEGCVSKKGNTFSCDVTFEEENPGEGKRIVPHFEPRK